MADPTPLTNKVQPGAVISRVNPDTGVKEFKQYAGGGVWRDIPPPTGKTIGSPVRAVTPDEEKALERRRVQAEGAEQLSRGNQRAVPASNALNSGPYRGMLLDAALPNPDNKGGWLDSIGASVIGPIAKLTGAITPEDIQNYQTVKRAENEAVSAKQLPQKGSQTEADAARYAMTGVRTSNSPRQNQIVANQDAAANAYLQNKRQFEANWALKYGLNGTDPSGRDMTTAFQQTYRQPAAGKGPVIRRVN